MVIICALSIPSEAEHLFACLLACSTYSFVKCIWSLTFRFLFEGFLIDLQALLMCQGCYLLHLSHVFYLGSRAF